MSYAGGVYFNMSVDPDLVDAYRELPRLFLEDLTEMAGSFGMEATQQHMILKTEKWKVKREHW